MGDIPSSKPPPDVWPEGEIIDEISWSTDPERLRRLRLALEMVRQQAKTLNEEITQKMDRLGLRSSTDKAKP